MPAAWIGAGAAAIGAGTQLAGAIGGSNPNSNAASTANPFGAYQPGFASQLANVSGPGAAGGWTYGNPSSAGLTQTSNLVNGWTVPLTSALNGVSIGNQINSLIANPSSIYQTPQYQAAFGQGQNAVNASLAAQGLSASGNQLAALQSYGQTFGQNAYNTQLSQLSGLYGQSLGANQQQYNQVSGMNQQAQAQQQQAFNQMGQLSGLLQGSPVGAAQLLAAGNQQVSSGLTSGISGLATAGENLYNAGAFGGSSTPTGGNTYGFTTGLPTDSSYGVSFTGY